MLRYWLLLVGVIASPLLHSRPAMADYRGLECGLADEGVIVVDGLADDWKGVAGVTESPRGIGEPALRVRCNYTGERLYLRIDVTTLLIPLVPFGCP